jgi:hypothetical protein
MFTSFFDTITTKKKYHTELRQHAKNTKSKKLLSRICFQFRHKSFDTWLAWVRGQPNDSQTSALGMLLAHLEGPVSNWQEAVTPDVLINLPIFMGLKNFSQTFTNVLEKLRNTSQEELPNQMLYFKSAIIPFVTIYPGVALEQLNKELKHLHKSDGLSQIEKKKFVLQQICRINDNYNENNVFDADVLDTILDTINDDAEESIIRYEAFTILEGFDDEVISDAYVKILRYFIEHTSALDDNLGLIYKEILKNLIFRVTEREIVTLFTKALKKDFLRNITISVISNILVGLNDMLTADHLYMIYNLDDPDRKDLTNVLAKRNGLNESELMFLDEKLPKYLDREDLIDSKELNVDDLPIPENQLETIEKTLKKLGKTVNEYSNNYEDELEEERDFGSLSYETALFKGDNSFDKIYLARLFCLIKGLDFMYFSFSDLLRISPNEPQVALEKELNNIPDNTAIYFDEIDLLYEDTNKNYYEPVNEIITYFAQDARFMVIASSENLALKKENDPIWLNIQSAGIFKNLFDFSLPGKYDLIKIIESIAHGLNKKRLQNMENLINQFTPIASNKSALQFYYLAAKYIKLMLVIQNEYNDLDSMLKIERKYEDIISDLNAEPEKKALNI